MAHSPNTVLAKPHITIVTPRSHSPILEPSGARYLLLGSKRIEDLTKSNGHIECISSPRPGQIEHGSLLMDINTSIKKANTQLLAKYDRITLATGKTTIIVGMGFTHFGA